MKIFILHLCLCVILFFYILKFVRCSEIRGPLSSCRNVHENYYYKKAGLKSISEDELYVESNIFGYSTRLFPELIGELVELPEITKNLLLTGSLENPENFFESLVYFEKEQEDETDKNLYSAINQDESMLFSFNGLIKKNAIVPLYYKRYVSKIPLEEKLTYYIHPLYLIADFLETDMSSKDILNIIEPLMINSTDHKLSYGRNLNYNRKLNHIKSKVLDDGGHYILHNLIQRKRSGSVLILKKLIKYGLDIKLFKKYPELFTSAVKNSNLSLVKFILEEIIRIENLEFSNLKNIDSRFVDSKMNLNKDFYINENENTKDFVPETKNCNSRFLVNLVDNYNHTSLYYAVKNNDLEMARILIEKGACVNMWDPRTGYNPLMLALENHNGAMLGLIMNNGGDPLRISPVSGFDVMDLAIKENDAKMIEKIVNHKNYDINTSLNDLNSVIMEYATFQERDLELVEKNFKKKLNRDFVFKQINDYEKEAKHILDIVKARISDPLLNRLLKMESKKKVALFCQVTDDDGRGALWWSAYYGNIRQIQYILNFYSKAIRNKWVGYKNCNPHRDDKHGIYPLSLILRKSLKFPRKLIIDMLQFHDPMTNAPLILQILTKSKQPLRALKNIVYTLRDKFNISYSFLNIWSDNDSVIHPIYYAVYKQLSPDVIYFLLEIATKYTNEIIGSTSKWRSKVIYSIKILKNAKNVDISSILQFQEGNFYLEHGNENILYSRFYDNFGLGTRRNDQSNIRGSDKNKFVKETKDFFVNDDLDYRNIFDNKWRTNMNHNIYDERNSKKPYQIQNDLIPVAILPPNFSSLIITKNYTALDKSSENLARIIIGRGPSHKSIDNIRKLLEHAVGLESDLPENLNNQSFTLKNSQDESLELNSDLESKIHSNFRDRSIKLNEQDNKNVNKEIDENETSLNSEIILPIKRCSNSYSIISPFLLNYSPNYTSRVRVDQKFVYPFGEASIDLIHSIVKLRPETIGEVLTRTEYKSPSDTRRVLALLEALPHDIPPFDKNALSPLQTTVSILYKYQGQRDTLPVINALLSPRYIKLFSSEQISESLNILALIDYKPNNIVELLGGFSRCNSRYVNKWMRSNIYLESSKFENIINDGSHKKNSQSKNDRVQNYNIYFDKLKSVGSNRNRPMKLNIIEELRNINSLPWDKNLTESDIIFFLLFILTVIIFFSIYCNSYNNACSISSSIEKKTFSYSNKCNCSLLFSEDGNNFLMDFGLVFMFNIPLPSKGNIKSGIWNSINSCFLLNKISDFLINKNQTSKDLHQPFEFLTFTFITKFSKLFNAIKSFSILLIFLWILVCQIYEEIICFLFLTTIAILVYAFHGYRIDENMYIQLTSCFKCENYLLLPDITILYEQTNSQVLKIVKRAIDLHCNLKKVSLSMNSDQDEYSKNIGKLFVNKSNLYPLNINHDLPDIGLMEISKTEYYDKDKKFHCYRLLFLIQLICIFFSFFITIKLPLNCYRNPTTYQFEWKNSIYDPFSIFSNINNCRKLYQFQYPNLYQLTRFYPITVSIMHFITFVYYWQLLSMISSPILSIILALYHFYSLANVFNFALSAPISILLPNARTSKLLISNSYSSKEVSQANSVGTPNIFNENRVKKEKYYTQNGIPHIEDKSVFVLSKNIQNTTFGDDNPESLGENQLNTKIGEPDNCSPPQLTNALSSPNILSPQSPEIELSNFFKLNNSYMQNQDLEYFEFKHSFLNSSIDDNSSETTYYQVLEAQIYPFFIWADSRRTSHRICKYFWKPLDVFRDIIAILAILLTMFYYYVELFSLPIKTIRLWEVVSLSIFSLGLFLIYMMYLMVEIHKMTLKFWQWVPDVYDVLPICSNLLNSVETTMRLLPFLTSPFYILNIPVKFPLLFASILSIILSINIIV